MKSLICLASCATLGLSSVSRAATDEPDPNGLRVFFKNSLRLESNDGRTKFRLGGSMQEDWTFSDEDSDLQDAGLDFEDGTEFRRARIYASGIFDENFEFKTQYDFAGGDTDFRDVYVGILDLGGGVSARVGQFKEPYSMDELTSSNDLVFLERGLPNAFSPGRNAGVMFQLQPYQNGGISFGYFRDVNDYGNGQEDGNHAFTGRATLFGLENDDGSQIVHAGVAATYRGADSVQFRSRPEAHLAPYFVDTTELDADHMIALEAELAAVVDAFSFQGEYHYVDVDGGSDPNFSGFTVQGTYAITGERRPYDRELGVFKRLIPEHAFDGKEGTGHGAWEIAARYSLLDLDDGPVTGGDLQTLTFGLNWYLNANLRTMFDFVYADQRDIGKANILETRVQFAF